MQKQYTILGYLPKKSEGWILQFIFKDISHASSRPHSYFLASSILELFDYLSLYDSAFILILPMHQSFVRDVLRIGVPHSSITCYYTHVFSKRTYVSDVKRCSRVLVLNKHIRSSMIKQNVDANSLFLFPAGYSSDLFSFPSFCTTQREFDFVYVGRFVDSSSSSSYYTRKNFNYLFSLLENLSKKGHKLAILGKDWSSCTNLPTGISILEVDHKKYPEIYQNCKICLNVSIVEGGPVSWLEAMASGCFTISMSTGFPSDHISGQYGSWHLNPLTPVTEFVSLSLFVLGIFNSLDIVRYSEIMRSRREILNKSDFSSLATTVEQPFFDSISDNCHLN
ncbi:glycosyltransferase [bacterium]|nr:glycosyltransferase [bacterium]